MTAQEQPPALTGNRVTFSTNKEGERTVARDLNDLLLWTRFHGAQAPHLAIATAYFNPGGFNLIADELEQASGLRLLLGAEPLEGTDRPRVRPLGERRTRRGPDPAIQSALTGHTRSMETDRDLLGFSREADAQAKRLVAWLRGNPVTVQVRRYEQGFLHGKAFIIDQGIPGLLAGSSNFTYAGLATNNELNIGRYEDGPVLEVVEWFNEQWDASVPYDLAALYEARWDAHTPWDVFLRMLWEMYGADLEAETDLTSRLGLTGFQADGVWRAKRLLAQRNGVIIADEVGLGKTFIAGELIHEAVFDRRQKVLIVAPATLRDSTWEPFLQKYNLRADCVSFEQLVSNIEDAGARTSALQNPDDYAMVIVDEAHALRSSTTLRADAMRTLLAGNVPKQLVEMTATPVNNSLWDLYNLISYYAKSDASFGDVGIASLSEYFKTAMAMDPDALTPEHLFDVMDEVAVRRTRQFVKTHYAGDTVVINGVEQAIKFPTCRVHRVDYDLDTVAPGLLDDFAVALGADVADDDLEGTLAAGVLMVDPGEVLTMARYVPSQFLLHGEAEQYEAQNAGLLRSALLKRFESSAYAFEKTLAKMIASHDDFLLALDGGKVLTGDELREWSASDADNLDDFMAAYAASGRTIEAADAALYDADALRDAVTADRALLEAFRERALDVHSGHDPKVAALIEELATIAAHAATVGIGAEDTRNKRKTLLFSYFADTVDYLNDTLSAAIATDDRLAGYRGRMMKVTGDNRNQRANIVIGFAPTTAGTGVEDDLYDLVITTDTLAEGVNLQQAANIINADLPWNPMRLVQRHGRIDRIGSPHDEVFMRCVFPSADLDRLLDLEARLQRKIKQAAAAVGVGAILPGMDPVERVITETRDQIDALRREEAALFEEGGPGALSGEEYRRRLATSIAHDATKARVLALPWGSGTGFARNGAVPGMVFCARIGDHPKPWFRYVPLTDDLTARTLPADEQRGLPERPEVIEDTLSCLDQADPRSDTLAPLLEQPMYEAAFDAWAAARDHIHAAWTIQTDPANLAPSIPKTMRDASALVRDHGRALGEQQDVLTARLNAPYPARVQRQVREIVTGPASDEGKVEALQDLANRLGLTPPPPVQPLPPITPDDIHLVCWTAITPTPVPPTKE